MNIHIFAISTLGLCKEQRQFLIAVTKGLLFHNVINPRLRWHFQTVKEISAEYSLEGLVAEVPILWAADTKSLLIGKDLMLERLKAKREGGSRG